MEINVFDYVTNIDLLCQAVRSKRNNSSTEDNEEPEISGRVAGTVRRHIPIDTRDPSGAILHFYIGDSYESNRLLHNSLFLI
jgi:senataxin